MKNGYREHPGKENLEKLLRRRTDAEAECTEDGRDGRIGATEYAEGNGTRKEAEMRNV